MNRVLQSLGVLLCANSFQGCTALLDFSEPVTSAVDASREEVDATTDAPPNLDTCGDGSLEAPEGCDDNNRTALDGCSANCSIESGYACSGEPSICTTQAICPAATIAVTSVLDSCLSYYNAGYRASGVYRIDPDGAAATLVGFDVICDMNTAGGGWTVIVNNDNDAVEPEGCLPRLATVDAFACGEVFAAADFAVPAYGMPFTELAWVAHDGNLGYGAHHLFRWASARTLPNETNWTLNAGEFGLKLPGLEAQELIECQATIAPAGLRRIANENVKSASGGFDVTDVVTIWDEDTSALTTGNMSFTDVDSAGLDDFQDGDGCGDAWGPMASRGAASLIMIR